MARENISEDYARSRIAAQKGEDFFRQRCAHTLENDGTLFEFEEKCQSFLTQILD